ncbi:hypothetical protein D3C80_1735780 [compost metagenome]
MLCIQRRQIAEYHPLEGTFGGVSMDHPIPRQPQALIGGGQARAEGLGELAVDGIPHPMDGIDVGHLEQFGQGRFTGQRQDLRLESRVQLGLVQNGDEGRQQG